MGLAEALNEEENVELFVGKTRQIRDTSSNVNTYSELECVSNFRFKREHNEIVCNTMDRDPGVIAQNGYSVGITTAISIVLRNVVTLVRLFDLEPEFDMHNSQLSNVLREVMEHICDTCKYLLALLSGLLQQCAPLYAKSNHAPGSSFDR